jgi:hypothetical protein
MFEVFQKIMLFKEQKAFEKEFMNFMKKIAISQKRKQ